MYQQEVQILNSLGLHARPASIVVKTANRFSSDVHLVREDSEVNAKSILGVMTLAAGPGSTLTIVAEGVDEIEAVKAIAEQFQNKFGEE